MPQEGEVSPLFLQLVVVCETLCTKIGQMLQKSDASRHRSVQRELNQPFIFVFHISL